jgi:hypothetical protein
MTLPMDNNTNLFLTCSTYEALSEGVPLGQADGMSPPQRRRAGKLTSGCVGVY